MIVYAALGGLAGAIVGSFLATLVLRWPQGRSVARGRSACDSCGRVLGVRDLVPLVPRRLCRTCQGTVDPLHWRMEWASAAIGAGSVAAAPGLGGAAWAVLGWCLLALAVLDARHFWLPNALTVPLALFGLALGPWATPVAFPDRLIGLAAGYVTLFALAYGYRALRGREGLGLGDAKLLGALGAWFGWAALPFILLSSSVLGLLIALLARRPISVTTRLPLGTFLCIGALPGWLLACRLLGLA